MIYVETSVDFLSLACVNSFQPHKSVMSQKSMQYIQDRYLFRRIRHELFENVFNNPKWSLRNLNVNASRKIYQRALDFHFLDS